MIKTDVKITGASGRTLQQFQDLIEQRIRWCNETREDAVAAIAITALRSIRAATKVANDKKPPKVELQATSFSQSWERVGGHKKPCVRNAGGVKYALGKSERLLIEDMPTKGVPVYKYVDDRAKGGPVTYYVMACTMERAEWAVQRKILNRIRAWKGLARKALSVLMQKTCTLNEADHANANVTKTANQATVKTDVKSADHYELHLTDALDYAVAAVEGGNAIVDMALKKAANKAASTINMKCKKILEFQAIETPFPEVSSRRK